MGCIIPGLRDRDLKKTGISRYGFISTAEILFSDAVRKICENDTCRLYGRTWACPPAVGTVEQCRQRCLRYEKAMVFDAVYPLTDPFDYEGMTEGHGAFKKLCDRLYILVKNQLSSFLLLSNEGCNRCEPAPIRRVHAECGNAVSLFGRLRDRCCKPGRQKPA